MKDFKSYLTESRWQRFCILEGYNKELTDLIIYVVEKVSGSSCKGFFPGAGLSNFERFYDNRELYAKYVQDTFGEAEAERFLSKVDLLEKEIKIENGKKSNSD